MDNLASLSETDNGTPLLTQMDKTASVATGDIALGYVVNDYLTLGATVEMYNYDTVFKESFAIAPVEKRAVLTADFNYGAWMFYSSASWIGSRDLTDYGYEGYNIPNTDRKRTRADSYWTIDMKLTYDVSESLSVYIGGNNLTDYTQVDDAETPLFWDAAGSYDVAYIYGPLRGREYYVGLEWSL